MEVAERLEVTAKRENLISVSYISIYILYKLSKLYKQADENPDPLLDVVQQYPNEAFRHPFEAFCVLRLHGSSRLGASSWMHAQLPRW